MTDALINQPVAQADAAQTDTPAFSDITTIRIGGAIRTFVQPATEDEFIDAVRSADSKHERLCVIGGGSNMLVSDAPFDGTVVRDARHGVDVQDMPEKAAQHNGEDITVTAQAGVNWDDFVAFTVTHGLEGVEGLSGIPGTVGASVVQNIGAYGQEVASSIRKVRVWDRQERVIRTLDADDLRFGYRTSSLKTTMYTGSLQVRETTQWFPTPRFIVLEVTYVLHSDNRGTVGMGQLAKALGVDVGERMELARIRDAVLKVRAGKDMLEDPTRYANRWMAGTKASTMAAGTTSTGNDDVAGDGDTAGQTAQPNHNRWSCGSFFINPVVTVAHAQRYLDGAPQYPVALPDGTMGVKTSAAWLIDHAGFHRGFTLASSQDDDAQELHPELSRAGLSTVHTLALTNRGQARFDDVMRLAASIQKGVEDTFGIHLVPEPVIVR